MEKINIFISENDTLDNALKIISDNVLDSNDTKKSVIQNKINKIFSKVYNNKVGYYISYNQGDNYYLKLYVLPKNIDKPTEAKDSQKQVIKSFLKYMTHHYRLSSEYKEYRGEYLKGSNQDISFDVYSSIKSAQSMEELIFFKYKAILQEIRKFFIRHELFKRRKIEYVSQSLKNKLNLNKNIKEINKTLIHQEKSYDILYSELATVAFAILKLFLKKTKLLNIQDKKEIISITKSIINLLIKKYRVNSKVSLNKQQLLSKKTYKYFRKKTEHKKLYGKLLALFGIENFFDEESNKDILLDMKADALFIQPDVMYEWYVYDWIIRKYCRAKKIFNIDFSIEKDKKQIYIKSKHNIKDYSIIDIDKNKGISTRSSKPDIVITGDRKKVIIDVKWKILEDLNSDDKESTNPKGLSMSDVLKLRRDMQVHRENETDEAFLVFAGLSKDVDGREYGVSYFDEIDFRFRLVEIPIYL